MNSMLTCPDDWEDVRKALHPACRSLAEFSALSEIDKLVTGWRYYLARSIRRQSPAKKIKMKNLAAEWGDLANEVATELHRAATWNQLAGK